jgi:hypothetical protein
MRSGEGWWMMSLPSPRPTGEAATSKLRRLRYFNRYGTGKGMEPAEARLSPSP